MLQPAEFIMDVHLQAGLNPVRFAVIIHLPDLPFQEVRSRTLDQHVDKVVPGDSIVSNPE